MKKPYPGFLPSQEGKRQFDTYMGVKKSPNEYEKRLFERIGKHIRRIAWIPGVEMVAVVNSLSMFATHDDSDIDLFIITKPGTLWLVRFFVTFIFWISGVWRHGEDIAGNFCLSFFVTRDAMDMSEIALEDDIYLYYWIYYMKPIFTRGDIYEHFLGANSWVQMDAQQIEENKSYIKLQKPIGKISKIFYYMDRLIKSIFLPRTLKNHEKLGKPEGVIITDSILKFHDQDRRAEVRENIFQKNFDK